MPQTDSGKVARVLEFFRQLRHTKGEWRGKPFTLLPWQTQALTDVFGAVRENGFRQYNTAYVEAAKKQGKSEFAAGIALYLLTSDEEWAAEIYSCAADRQQAAIVFDVAAAMVEQSPTLRRYIRPVLSQKRLVYLPTKSFYQVLSAESYSKHGFNVHGVVFDELHAQPDRGLFDVMSEGAGDARRQPLMFIITTAGDDPDRESIGWEVHQHAVDVLTGARHDPAFYAMIYGLDRENKRIWTGRQHEVITADWENEATWRAAWSNKQIWAKVNPSLEHTVALEKVEDHYARAQGNPAREKNFRWLRLNCWESVKTAGWLGLDAWDRCKARLSEKALQGRACYGGLDLSSKTDLTAFVLLFPPDEANKKWAVLPRFWIPEDNIADRVRTDKVPYNIWKRQGHLKTTPGNVIDYAFIEAEIIALRDLYDIQEIGFDPWNALQTSLRLTDAGLMLVEVRQGYKTMSPAMKELEALVLSRKLAHSGHPVLRWNIGNVRVKLDENDNIRPIKGKGVERIDGLVAIINAMDRALRHEQAHKSVYDESGLLVVEF